MYRLTECTNRKLNVDETHARRPCVFRFNREKISQRAICFRYYNETHCEVCEISRRYRIINDK